MLCGSLAWARLEPGRLGVIYIYIYIYVVSAGIVQEAALESEARWAGLCSQRLDGTCSAVRGKVDWLSHTQ